MIPGRWSRFGLMAYLALAAACTPSSSDKKADQVTPDPPNPPVVEELSCDDGHVFWSDPALLSLEAQLRTRLPVESEYWLGTIDSTVVCQLLRPSCPESDYLSSYFSLICPEEKSLVFLDKDSETALKLQQVCEQQDQKKFHRCQSVLTERLLEKAFVPVTDRPRFYTLKSE